MRTAVTRILYLSCRGEPPKDPEEFMKGNFGFGSLLLDTLKKHGNKAPVMLSSSIQASLEGRYAGSEYGKSKLAGEELFRQYSGRPARKC